MRKRVTAAVLTAATAVGLVAGGAPGARAASVIADVSYSVAGVVSHTTSAANGAGCTAVLLSEQVTAGGPAYVSGYLQNVEAGRACSGWLERSANGGQTWSALPGVVRAPSAAGFTDWVKLGERKAGPGRRARVCFRMKASPAAADGFPLPLSYLRAHRTFGTTTSGECVAYVSSSTVAKKAGTRASGLFVAFGAVCTGFEQTSANGGATWTTVSRRFVFSSKTPATAWSFTATHPDGTGRLARACVALGTARARCSPAW
jgi:hypothetical protein